MYTVDWSGAAGIVNVKCSFDLVSVSVDPASFDPALPLSQTFETRFREAAGNKNSVKFSGNPGYVVGEPIRAGKLNSTGSASVRYFPVFFSYSVKLDGGSVAEWLACWTQAQKGPGSNRSRDAVG